MRCVRIQELLKTDYLDGMLNQAEEQYIKEHLRQCSLCRNLERELQIQHLLFKNAKQRNVPQGLWHNIRNAIIEERLAKESRVIHFRTRPVFALASAMALVIFIAYFAGIIIQKHSAGKTAKDESITEYLLSQDSQDLLLNLGTNVEEYFL